jgi:outer membrane protein assembly factor BamB
VKVSKGQKGQSTIEFLSALSFILAIIFFYVKMALNIINGYLMHYATFMGSRAYLVYDGGQNSEGGADGQAKARAAQVFNGIKAWAIGLEGNSALQFNSPGENDKNRVYVGAWVRFRQKFSYSAVVGGLDLMTYVSESFLGREPTSGECTIRTCEMLYMSNKTSESCAIGVTVVDNGC